MNESKSGFIRILEESIPIFAKSCNILIANCKETTDESFLSFIKSYSFQEPDFEYSIYTCGSIGSAKPFESFLSLIGSFIIFDLSDPKEPSNHSSTYFIPSFSSIKNKWNDKYTRSCVLYTLYYIISKTCKIICEQSRNSISADESVQLIQHIQIWNSVRSKDPLQDEIKMIVIDYLKSAICFISKKCETSTFNIISPIFENIESQSKFAASMLFTLFSEIFIRYAHQDQFHQLFNPIRTLYLKNESTPEISAFLMNLIGFGFSQFDSVRKSPDILTLFEGCLQHNDPHSFEMAAMLAAFSETSQLNLTLSSFFEEHLLAQQDIDGKRCDHILKALTRFLYSSNYAPLSILQIEYTQYSWRFPHDQNQSILETFHKLKKHPEILDKSSSIVLADFILQISSNDISIFVNVLYNYMKDKNTMQEAACIIFTKMLSVYTQFFDKAAINSSRYQEFENIITKEAYKLCKRFLNTISDETKPSIYLTPSFTSELKFISSPMNDSRQAVHKILTNTLAVTPNFEHSSARTIIALSKWKKDLLFKENLESVKLQESCSIKETDLKDFTKSFEKNRTLIRALHLAPMVIKHDKILKWICAKIINREPAVGAAAVRALQAILHLNVNTTSKVVNEIYSLIENSNINTYSLFSIISALKNTMETVAFEEYQMPKSTSLKMIYILSLGLTCPYFLTRLYTLDCVDYIPHSIINHFFNKIHNTINLRGRELAFNVMSPSFEDLDSLKIIDFPIVTKSVSQYLYSFYLISFFETIKSQNIDDDQDSKYGMKKSSSSPDIDHSEGSICLHLRSFLTTVLAKAEKDTNVDPYFIINLIAALFALGLNNDQNQEIESYIQKVKKLDIPAKKDWICSITSTLSISLISTDLIKILPYRALALYLLRAAKNAKFIENSGTKYLEAIQTGYKRFLHHVFKDKIVLREATFQISHIEKLTSQYKVALYAFGCAFTTIFNSIAVRQTGYITQQCGIFPRNPIVFPLSDSVFTSNESYAFWFNLSSASNEYFSVPCQFAYAELVKIMMIPDIWFELVSNHIDTIVKNTPDIATTLLTNYPGVLMPLYVQNAPKSFTFFEAIAKQLCSVDTFFTSWIKHVALQSPIEKSTKIDDSDSEIKSDTEGSQFVQGVQVRAANAAQRLSSSILRNLGTLQAIASSYLISSDYLHRITAFDFIYVTALSAHLMHADKVIESLNFSKALLSMRDSFKANLTQFFSKTARSLVEILAENLPFISEQFCFTIFTIESIKGNALIPSNDSSFSSKSRGNSTSIYQSDKANASTFGIRKVSFASISIPSQSSLNFLLQDISNANSSNSFSLSPISNLKQSFSQTVNDQISDKDFSEMLRMYVSFVVPWMKNLHYDTDRIHIFDDCYPSYQMFSMYSFIQTIAKMQCLRHITPPITNILYTTYNASKEFFLITLVDIYFSIKDNSIWRDNCISLITYAYSIDSKSVMNYFMTFFTPKLWYYHQIQISKLNQAFDLKQFFADIETSSGKLSLEEKFDYPTMIKFAVRMLLNFYRENPTNVLPYKNLIIVFCALMNSELKELAQEVFKSLLNLEPPLNGSVKYEKNISFIGPFIFEHFMELIRTSINSHLICLIDSRMGKSLQTNGNPTRPPNNPALPNSLIQNLIVPSLYWEDEISRFLLRWGLICGDSYLASMALKMFITLGFTANEENISIALDSIYMIYLALRDAQLSKGRSQRQIITKLSDGDGQPDYCNAYHHIKYLCLLCQHVSNPSPKLLDKILLTSFALLLLPELGKISKDQDIAKSGPTIEYALGNIYMYRERLKKFKPSELIQPINQNFNNDDDEKLDLKDNLTDVFQGFVYYLLHTSLTLTSLKLSEDILLYLLQNDLMDILNGCKYDSVMTYYAILPYIFELESTKDTGKVIDTVEIEESYEEVAEMHNIESIANFHTSSMNHVAKFRLDEKGKVDFEALLRFYRVIIRIGSVKQAKAALTISSLFIENSLVLNSSPILSELSNDVLSRKEYELQDDTSNFFKLLMRIYKGSIAKITSKSNRLFPKIFLPISVKDFLNWKPIEVVGTASISSSNAPDRTNTNTSEKSKDQFSEINSNDISEFNESYDVKSQANLNDSKENIVFLDVFKRPKFYPPLFLTDYYLFVSDFMNQLRAVVEQIKVQPYSGWSEEVFRERQSNPRTTDDMYDDDLFEQNEVIFYDDELEGHEKKSLLVNLSKLDEIATQLKKLIANNQDPNSTTTQYTTTIIPEKSTAKYSFVDSNLFCPSVDVINQIGQKEIDQQIFAQLPPIFP